MVRARSLAAGLATVLICLPCRGDDNAVAAETLFIEGRKLMSEGKLPAACRKLEQSQKLDPGVGTLLYLAECFEKAGKTASAWVTFRDAESFAQRSGQADRARAAHARAEGLEAKLTRLTIVVPDPVRVPNLVIVRDGKEVPDGLWGTAVPVDPGVHEIQATAPGRAEFRTTLESRSANEVLTLPELVMLPAAVPGPKPSAAPPDPPPPGPRAAAPTDEPARGSSTKTVGYGVAAGGALALVGGLVMGLAAKSKYDGTSDQCNANNVCTSGGASDRDSARSRATIATVLTAVGVVGIGVGTTLVLTAAPQQHAGLSWKGTF
jgi:hypothetical protein